MPVVIGAGIGHPLGRSLLCIPHLWDGEIMFLRRIQMERHLHLCRRLPQNLVGFGVYHDPFAVLRCHLLSLFVIERGITIINCPVRSGWVGHHADMISHANLAVYLQRGLCQQKNRVGTSIQLDCPSDSIAMIGADCLCLRKQRSRFHPSVAVTFILSHDKGLFKLVNSFQKASSFLKFKQISIYNFIFMKL